MRLATILKIVGVLVIAVVVAVVAILMTIDPNDYKDDIQQAAKDATGRDLVIEGDISLELGLTIGLAIDGVRFSNAEWGSAPDMLTAKEVAVQVALMPLISGDLDIKGLTIRDAAILIEKDAQGRSNTEFKPAEGGAGAAGQDSGAGSAGGEDTDVNIAINNVVIENATVTMRDAQQNTETVVAVSTLNISEGGSSSTLDIELAAELTTDGNKVPVELNGNVGRLTLLMGGNQPYPVDVTGKALGFEFAAKGAINEPATMSGIALALEASAENLSGLAPFAGGAVLPAAGPFSFKGNVTGGGDAYAIEGFALKFGNTDLGGDVKATLSGARPRIDGTINAAKIDIPELMPADQGGAGGSAGSSSGGGGGNASGARPGKVFPADPLPLDGLKAADARLSLKVTELVGPNLTLSDVSAELALDNGNLAVEPWGFVMSGSRFDGAVSLAARSSPAKLSFAVKAPEIDMGSLLKDQADIELLRGDAAMDVDVTGTGDSVAAIMASLNGHSRFLMEKGEAKTESFDLIVGGLSSVMGTLFKSKTEWTVLNCLANDFKITNGIAENQIMLMDTELLTITGEGQVNLRDETLALKITPAPKSTTINVSVPIKIGGTLAKPTFAPDELATVKKLGSLFGLAVFPPAAVVGLAELGGEDNPCVKLAQEGGGQAQPQSGGSATEELVKEPEKVIEDVGKGIKNLFGR